MTLPLVAARAYIVGTLRTQAIRANDTVEKRSTNCRDINDPSRPHPNAPAPNIRSLPYLYHHPDVRIPKDVQCRHLISALYVWAARA